MKAFYGSRFSPNMTRTPEGFLICHNVPISRTGWMQYLGQEVKREDLYDKPVDVYRSPEEVFSPAAMASFEGKAVTDEHPSQWVAPDNYTSYMRGVTTNIRRGEGSESDCLIADLIIYDPTLISEVEHGKREVSCGYEHDLQLIEGEDEKYQQTNIRGNHVAIVTAGRAGDRIAIKDQKPKERSRKMKVDRNTLWGKMLSAFAKDAEPEELAEASKMGPGMEGKKETDSLAAPPLEPPKATDEPPTDPRIDALVKGFEDMKAVLAQLVQSDKQVHQEVTKDELESLVAELEKPEEQAGEENSVTIPAEQMDEAPVVSPEERPKNPIPGADRNAILNAIKAVRPIIAAIPDAGERKKAADALAKSFRDQLAKPANPSAGYAGILAAQQAATAKAKDSQPKDLTGLGKDIAKKYNPHYKEAK